MTDFPKLPEAALPARDALHDYSRLLGGLRRELSPPHPRWWHISLEVADAGLATGPLPLAGGDSLLLTLDVRSHRLIATRGETPLAEQPLDAGLPARELGRRLLPVMREAGAALPEGFTPKTEERPTAYDGDAARAYAAAFAATRDVFAGVRAGLEGELGPIQLWPHHFDLSFEWFGPRIVGAEEGGSPVQIGFGFSTGDDGHPAPYYYANPWPFDPALTGEELPEGARWQTESFEGSLLEYEAVRRSGGALLRRYCERVYELASPALRSG